MGWATDRPLNSTDSLMHQPHRPLNQSKQSNPSIYTSAHPIQVRQAKPRLCQWQKRQMQNPDRSDHRRAQSNPHSPTPYANHKKHKCKKPTAGNSNEPNQTTQRNPINASRSATKQSNSASQPTAPQPSQSDQTASAGTDRPINQ